MVRKISEFTVNVNFEVRKLFTTPGERFLTVLAFFARSVCRETDSRFSRSFIIFFFLIRSPSFNKMFYDNFFFLFADPSFHSVLISNPVLFMDGTKCPRFFIRCFIFFFFFFAFVSPDQSPRTLFTRRRRRRVSKALSELFNIFLLICERQKNKEQVLRVE